jgi:nicotinamide-nucleotide amidase
MKRFEDLEVYQKAFEFSIKIYKTTSSKTFDYNIKSQIQRAALSIPINIAEGFELQSNKQFVKFSYISKGSSGEVRSLLKICERLEYLKEQKVKELKTLISKVTLVIDNEETIEKAIGSLLKEKQQTVATAESLTGGKIASTIVSVAGASAYYKGSFVTYTATLKEQLLNVSKATIEKYTVVSKEVAKEMAIGTLKKLDTDYAIAVTGNAGPTRDNNDKTVGLVYIAIANQKEVEVHEFYFGKPREKVINKTITKALELLQKNILKNYA